ncbi:MAG: Asp-tRNA(Asn)/Glu-tRNA(Gln) amidotransferase subunit GatB [Pseudomonadota bacterium]
MSANERADPRWGDWEPVIGLEVHVQLSTRSKMFSTSSTAFGAAPNTQANAVDLGLPGVLPVINREAVRKAVQFGLAVGAEVNQRSVFDRKNYFYPDLPKGYQISQFKHPIVGRGALTVTLPGGEQRTIGITRAHLEEDAGKSIHDAVPGRTAIDLNRAGTPLLEVVSEPELRSASEAAAYFRTLHSLVRYLGICDGNLAEGSMRCDANVSVRRRGSNVLGQRTETKNINSFRFVEQAIDFEIARQIAVLEAGGSIVQETRLYDPDANETRAMRTKEDSDDYRYFPDPDLQPLVVSDQELEAIAAAMPELPTARRMRYVEQLGLTEYDAELIVADPDLAEYFEATAAAAGGGKAAANWILGDLTAALNRDECTVRESRVSSDQLGQLIQRINDGTISGKIGKTLFETLWNDADTRATVDGLIDARGLRQVSDSGAIETIVDDIIAANPKQVEQFKGGKDKVFGFFVGQVMKATQGKANPKAVNDILRAKLSG